MCKICLISLVLSLSSFFVQLSSSLNSYLSCILVWVTVWLPLRPPLHVCQCETLWCNLRFLVGHVFDIGQSMLWLIDTGQNKVSAAYVQRSRLAKLMCG